MELEPYKIKDGSNVSPLDAQASNKDSLIPTIPFSLQLIGCKSAGKSTTLISMLISKGILAGKFEKIILISPTNTLDEKIQKLSNCEGLTKINWPLLKEIQKRKAKIKKQLVDYNDEVLHDYSESDIDFYEDLDFKLLAQIKETQMKVIKEFGKKYADNILLVLDDMAASRKMHHPEFFKLVFNSRHYKLSLIITAQTYHTINKNIRLNNSILILFETRNIDELKIIYEENKLRYTRDEFLQIIKYVFSKPYNFLVLNFQNSPNFRVQEQFLRYIGIE